MLSYPDIYVWKHTDENILPVSILNNLNKDLCTTSRLGPNTAFPDFSLIQKLIRRRFAATLLWLHMWRGNYFIGSSNRLVILLWQEWSVLWAADKNTNYIQRIRKVYRRIRHNVFTASKTPYSEAKVTDKVAEST